MKKSRWILASASVVAVALALAAGMFALSPRSASAQAVTFHGQFTTSNWYCGATPVSIGETNSGTWNLNINGTTAQHTHALFRPDIKKGNYSAGGIEMQDAGSSGDLYHFTAQGFVNYDLTFNAATGELYVHHEIPAFTPPDCAPAGFNDFDLWGVADSGR